MTDNDRLLKRLQNLVKRMQLINDFDSIAFKKQFSELENDVTKMIEKQNAENLNRAINPTMIAAA